MLKTEKLGINAGYIRYKAKFFTCIYVAKELNFNCHLNVNIYTAVQTVAMD